MKQWEILSGTTLYSAFGRWEEHQNGDYYSFEGAITPDTFNFITANNHGSHIPHNWIIA